MSQTIFADSKPHYQILDGLRGVAAIMVIMMHIAEPYCGGDYTQMVINHGYLAVDFFFLLSGFVIAHAYDDRWGKMTLGDFFKRRLIRLHPMIIIGMTIGAICFYWTASPTVFPPVAGTPFWKMLLVMVIGYTLLPVPLSMDIRGWAEMHPLDGPAWTLFFEYIANILYALVLRRLPNIALFVLTLIAAGFTLQYGITGKGDFIGGWSLTAEQLGIGFTRLACPFLTGMLLARAVKPAKWGSTFLWSALLLIALLAWPRLGGHASPWMNGVYEAICIVVAFPLIVFLGASGSIQNKTVEKICSFLGNISYPVYIIHYPFIYLFTAWMVDNHKPFSEAWPAALLVFLGSISLAYFFFRVYDVPVRKWLTRKFIPKAAQ